MEKWVKIFTFAYGQGQLKWIGSFFQGLTRLQISIALSCRDLPSFWELTNLQPDKSLKDSQAVFQRLLLFLHLFFFFPFFSLHSSAEGGLQFGVPQHSGFLFQLHLTAGLLHLLVSSTPDSVQILLFLPSGLDVSGETFSNWEMSLQFKQFLDRQSVASCL